MQESENSYNKQYQPALPLEIASFDDAGVEKKQMENCLEPSPLIKGTEIFVECRFYEWTQFKDVLNKVKKYWFSKKKYVNKMGKKDLTNKAAMWQKWQQ